MKKTPTKAMPEKAGKVKTKKLQTIITQLVMTLILVSLAVVATASCITNMRSVRTTVEKSSLQTAKTAALAVQNKLEGTLNILTELGLDAELSAQETSAEEKQSLLSRKMGEHGLLGLSLADSAGNTLDGANVANQEFFTAAIKGKAHVTSPVVNGDSAVIYMSAPVWSGGISNTSVAGAVYATFDFTYLTDITNTITIGDTGSSYIIDGNDVTIAHKSTDSVLGMEKTADDAKSEPSLQPLAELELRAISGESCFGEYTYKGGVTKFAAMAPIAGTDNWALCVTIEKNEFMRAAYTSLALCVYLSIAALIVTFLVANMLAKRLTVPVRQLSAAAEAMAKGDFSQDITFHSQTELGQLADSMRQMKERTHFVISSTERVLEAMARGDFTTLEKGQYDNLGIYSQIGAALEGIENSLGSVLRSIKQSVTQVEGGAAQLSNSAQTLAQGATDQASSIDQLARSITDMRQHIQNSASKAEKASALSHQAETGIDQSNQKMIEMTKAMEVISAKANQIQLIIKTIDDISFQTNILALNAAVEAARAGEAGKGFAVVADEVRNLASKSSVAAKNTATLIEDTVHAVSGGVELSEMVKEALSTVTSMTEQVDAMLAEVSLAAAQQTEAVEKISSGIDLISDVVQNTSATSEENAAASEELSADATALKNEIRRFSTK